MRPHERASHPKKIVPYFKFTGANRNRIHQRAIVARGSKIWQRRAAAWVRPGEALINFEV